MSALPRVTEFQGVKVYAAHCQRCDSDKHTDWKRLPTIAELTDKANNFFFGRYTAVAHCEHCNDVVDVGFAGAHRAREPERLEARLAELCGMEKRTC